MLDVFERTTEMTEAQRAAIKILIERHTTANTASPEIARAALIEEGIYTSSGTIAPEYGGEKKVANERS
jgi:hypothetical protein